MKINDLNHNDHPLGEIQQRTIALVDRWPAVIAWKISWPCLNFSSDRHTKDLSGKNVLKMFPEHFQEDHSSFTHWHWTWMASLHNCNGQYGLKFVWLHLQNKNAPEDHSFNGWSTINLLLPNVYGHLKTHSFTLDHELEGLPVPVQEAGKLLCTITEQTGGTERRHTSM